MSDSFFKFYQEIPLHFVPEIFKAGSFSISWYSVMYLVAFLVVYLLLLLRIKKGEQGKSGISQEKIIDFLILSFLGLVIGARLGHVIFYNLDFYLENPLRIISPFDPKTHEYIGIYGMSFHGGMLGVFMASYFFLKRTGISLRDFSDFVVPAIPAGYFFGRVGNFINNELYGKITLSRWGMYFKDDSYNLRYPTQLLEAFLEGILIFAILWIFRNNPSFKGKILAFYLILYGSIRFFCEFFRETEKSQYPLHLINIAQILSLVMVASGGLMLVFQKRKKLL